MSVYNNDLEYIKTDLDEDICVSCQTKGLKVSYDTVLALCTDFIKTTLNYQQYYLCTNKDCDIAYFTENKKIMVNEIKVPIWFKNKKSKYIICYCRNISLDDIISAVKNMDEVYSIENILKYLKKDNMPTNCLLNMPTGESCNELFLNSIEYAKKSKQSIK